jgi:hypothetical protein
MQTKTTSTASPQKRNIWQPSRQSRTTHPGNLSTPSSFSRRVSTLRITSSQMMQSTSWPKSMIWLQLLTTMETSSTSWALPFFGVSPLLADPSWLWEGPREGKSASKIQQQQPQQHQHQHPVVICINYSYYIYYNIAHLNVTTEWFALAATRSPFGPS